jgi:hypothetical protein
MLCLEGTGALDGGCEIGSIERFEQSLAGERGPVQVTPGQVRCGHLILAGRSRPFGGGAAARAN